MLKPLFICGLLTALLSFHSVAQAGDKEEIAALKEALQQLTERLTELEAKRDVVTPSPAAAPSKAGAQWPEKVKINTDMRYRHESIDEDTKDERIRHRLRLRAGVVADVTDTAQIGFQLISGGDDPISGNQSLDGGASTKGVGLDLAYFSLKPAPGHKITGGKIKKPWYLPGKSSLMWDGDLNPEGLAWQYAKDAFFANVSGYWAEESSSRADSVMVAGQAGFKTKLGNGTKITAGAGYYDYGATQGREPFYDGGARGNTLDSDGNYANDFRIIQVFAELGTKIGEMPFSVYADLVKNSAASTKDSGTLYGMKLGKASAPASWEIGYNYRDLEADAVVGTFTDSDSGGGGTAISGHMVNFGYAFNKKVKAKLTYFISENQIDTPAERDYNRLQADFSLKY